MLQPPAVDDVGGTTHTPLTEGRVTCLSVAVCLSVCQLGCHPLLNSLAARHPAVATPTTTSITTSSSSSSSGLTVPVTGCCAAATHHRDWLMGALGAVVVGVVVVVAVVVAVVVVPLCRVRASRSNLLSACLWKGVGTGLGRLGGQGEAGSGP